MDPNAALRAWTGGDTPKDHGGLRAVMRDAPYRRLVGNLMRGQVEAWRAFWGDLPDADTAHIFAGRAVLDAWRSLHP